MLQVSVGVTHTCC